MFKDRNKNYQESRGTGTVIVNSSSILCNLEATALYKHDLIYLLTEKYYNPYFAEDRAEIRTQVVLIPIPTFFPTGFPTGAFGILGLTILQCIVYILQDG